LLKHAPVDPLDWLHLRMPRVDQVSQLNAEEIVLQRLSIVFGPHHGRLTLQGFNIAGHQTAVIPAALTGL